MTKLRAYTLALFAGIGAYHATNVALTFTVGVVLMRAGAPLGGTIAGLMLASLVVGVFAFRDVKRALLPTA